MLGITRGTTKAHLARAVLESIAYQTRDVVDAMTNASGTPLAELRVDGGASAADLLVRIQADQLGVPVRRSRERETTAQGAAFLAGLAEGFWASLDDVAAAWASDATFEADGDATVIEANYRRWLEAVERSAGGIDHSLEPNGELSDAPTEEPVSHPAVSTFGRRPSLTERSRELRWSRWIDP